jgi:hypothetical protein
MAVFTISDGASKPLCLIEPITLGQTVIPECALFKILEMLSVTLTNIQTEVIDFLPFISEYEKQSKLSVTQNDAMLIFSTVLASGHVRLTIDDNRHNSSVVITLDKDTSMLAELVKSINTYLVNFRDFLINGQLT